MKVFISWSGEPSRQYAEALRDWLPTVLQAIKPYFSPDDIAKGARWAGEVGAELQASAFGILCLTADNISAPWITFEAGALAKSLDAGRVCPLLFGIEPTDVTGPLSQFQSARFDRVEVARLMREMNSKLSSGALGADVLERVFDKWWPQLEADVKSVTSPTSIKPRDHRDLLEEILALSRSINASLQGGRGPGDDGMSVPSNDFVTAAVLADIAVRWFFLLDGLPTIGAEQLTLAARVNKSLQFLAKRSGANSVWKLLALLETLFDDAVEGLADFQRTLLAARETKTFRRVLQESPSHRQVAGTMVPVFPDEVGQGGRRSEPGGE